jgi:hypothetical protein
MSDLPHPDANLIDLGRQFEAAKAAALPLDRRRKATHDAREKALTNAKIPFCPADRTPEHRELVAKIEREVGAHAAFKAFSLLHNECIRLMKAIHKAKATTLEGFAVKLAAIAFDQSDFEVTDPVPTDVAERELYRTARDMAKVVKAIKRTDFPKLINTFEVARQAYEVAAKTDDTDGPVWDAYEAAEHAVIVYPCRTIEDVRLKAKFFLENEGPNDTLRNCSSSQGPALDRFLRSLIGEGASCD